MLEARGRLTVNFGAETAEIVLSVTKSKVNHLDIQTRDQALAEYYRRLQQAPPGSGRNRCTSPAASHSPSAKTGTTSPCTCPPPLPISCRSHGSMALM